MTRVVRSQKFTIQECLALCPRYIVIGPGPGPPCQAFFSKDLMKACAGHIPILGICLGHQILAQIYGGKINRAQIPMHGKTSLIFHTNDGIFRGIPQGFLATRYHSLIVEEDSLPSCLEITARTPSGEIMGLKHQSLTMESVQFHPESILSEHGLCLLKNFIDNL